VRLLDTDIISALTDARVSARMHPRLDSSEPVYTSAINLAEILYGLQKRPSENLRELYETMVFPRLVVLPFGEQAAQRYAELRALLEARGIPLDLHDLMIASVALANNLILVTGNVSHFSRVPGLEIENWLEQ